MVSHKLVVCVFDNHYFDLNYKWISPLVPTSIKIFKSPSDSRFSITYEGRSWFLQMNGSMTAQYFFISNNVLVIKKFKFK